MNILKNAMKRKARHIEQFKHVMPTEAMAFELRTLEIMRKIQRGAYANEPKEMLETLIEKLCVSAERNTKWGIFWFALRIQEIQEKTVSFFATNFNLMYKKLKRLKRKNSNNKQSNYFFSGVATT